MLKSDLKELVVLASTHVSDNMLRITLGGDDIARLPADQESAYIKLVFPQEKGERPLLRTYTIRHQREAEIDVDFALHSPMGPATRWAVNARPGDRILVGGPGDKKMIYQPADWFLLAGDMAALPALSVNLARLPERARGYAVIEVVSEADIQDLSHPEHLRLHWVINPHPTPERSALLDKIQSLPRLDGDPAVWAACEFNAMRALRRYLKQEYDLAKSHLYISSYWKLDQSEDEHKVVKRQDSEQEAAAR
ncbi:siderophore-interacting protein [Oceanimonas doudoroffii]|uniref:NADPH-dependent ferric siderophore reductase n=1 Tax=Oceanimonas doudoroffii TaxID=84158 RepID=A0A233RHM0_9GAMM|nr:siderophore-interacting protein [Oceanimonas doudoroffii]OXY82882.1 NADPH-dependent ferric siderophore reductase [Oceanimonas doudoroffii]